MREPGSMEPHHAHISASVVAGIIFAMLAMPFNIFSSTFTIIDQPESLPDSIPLSQPVSADSYIEVDSIQSISDGLEIYPADSLYIKTGAAPQLRIFNPDPIRAVWLSALFPGLGQIYNRRYWKLPIVVGAYMGLGYGTNWNNSMLRDYTNAYADLMDNDPTTRSYMDFFPTNTREEDLDKSWLGATLRNRKDYFRRNRDLCIICMIGVYLVAMVDAYVDASLAHFDITPDLSMQVAPAVIPDGRHPLPSIGVQWALNF